MQIKNIFRLVLFAPIFAFSQEIKVDFTNEVRPIISVEILDKSTTLNNNTYAKYLSVYMVKDDIMATSPLSGIYSYFNSNLIFTPLGDVSRNTTFEIRFLNGSDTLKKRITIPKLNTSKIKLTEVSKFFPIKNELPQNILRFHIQFSSKMTPDEFAFMNVDIFDDKNNKVKMLWQHKSYWISDSILTLSIQPSSIKKVMTNREERDPMFEINKTYKMVISPQMKDIYERDIKQSYSRTFKITEPDTFIPKLKPEYFVLPEVDSKKHLEIVFSEGVDFVSIIEGVSVIDKNTNQKIEGFFDFTYTDKAWHFVPKQPWKATEYSVIFSNEVSDFASNNLHRLFENKDLNQLKEGIMPIKFDFTPKLKQQ